MKTSLPLLFFVLAVCSCKTQTFGLTDKNLHSGQVYTTYNIFYSLGRDSLLIDNCKSSLDSIFNFLDLHPDLKVEIGNHTGFRGDDQQNLALSQKRSDKLCEYFISRGIKQDKIIAKGYGESKPLLSKQKQDKLGNHAKNVNLRVTLKIIK
jgi:outer membrane protein OmpA-like peptidoglycan-associated protein